jgi:hypothetical protein
MCPYFFRRLKIGVFKPAFGLAFEPILWLISVQSSVSKSAEIGFWFDTPSNFNFTLISFFRHLSGDQKFS